MVSLEPLLGLIQNAALLLALALVFDIAILRSPRETGAEESHWLVGRPGWWQIPFGLVLGMVGMAVMLTPWTLVPGLIFDTRSVLLGVSGLFFGVVPTLIAMAMTISLRLYQGGSGAVMGVSVILATGLIGMAWRHLRRKPLAEIGLGELYLFGIVLHVAMLAMAFTLPLDTALNVVYNISLPVMIIYPVGTALLGALMASRLRREQIKEALRASEERLRLAIEASNIGFFDSDYRTNTVHYSPEWKKQIGYQSDELSDTREEWVERLHPDDVLAVQARLDDCLRGVTPHYEAEYRLRHKDGSYRWILARAVMQYDSRGQPLRLLGCQIDISSHKNAEEEVRRLNAELEQRVVERTTLLQAANDELESFSYSVAHDLRSPLRAMSGFSAILLAEHAAQLDAHGREYLTRIQDAAHRMGQLISDLLGLSRITRSPFQRQTVDLSNLAQQISARLLAQEEPGRSVALEISDGITAEGDPALLQKALENLLHNALKFTGRRADARVSFGVLEQGGERIYFVRDNGAGFNMEYSDKLFVPFQRLHAVADFPGSGIGLVAVQRIINRHGGRIWAEAAVGEGAVFYFTLGAAARE